MSHPSERRAFPARICQGAAVTTEASSPTVPGRRLLICLLVVFVFAVVPAVFVPTLMCRPADPEIDDFGELPTFTLADERGQPFTKDALLGHITIVSFIFTRCDSICPVTSMKMSTIQEQTFDQGAKIKLLSISIDPTYDTPERLAAYATRFHADPTRWRFVTGADRSVRTLVEQSFMQNMQLEGKSPSGAPNIAHNGYFALVDAHGHLRQSYDSKELPKLDELVHAARFLARKQL
jgi:protein SCO1/2